MRKKLLLTPYNKESSIPSFSLSIRNDSKDPSTEIDSFHFTCFCINIPAISDRKASLSTTAASGSSTSSILRSTSATSERPRREFVLSFTKESALSSLFEATFMSIQQSLFGRPITRAVSEELISRLGIQEQTSIAVDLIHIELLALLYKTFRTLYGEARNTELRFIPHSSLLASLAQEIVKISPRHTSLPCLLENALSRKEKQDYSDCLIFDLTSALGALSFSGDCLETWPFKDLADEQPEKRAKITKSPTPSSRAEASQSTPFKMEGIK